MTSDPTTRRLLSSLRKDGKLSSRSEFLIPAGSDSPVAFVGIESRKPHARGVVTFVGREVGVEDLLGRARDLEVTAGVRAMIRDYLTQVSTLKLGNVVEADGSEPGTLKLVVVEQRPPSDGRRNLP